MAVIDELSGWENPLWIRSDVESLEKMSVVCLFTLFFVFSDLDE